MSKTPARRTRADNPDLSDAERREQPDTPLPVPYESDLPPPPADAPAPPIPTVFDQYYPGGVMKQMADAAGIDVRALNPDVPGGVMEQLRVAADPSLELSQHGPGGAAGQIGYTLVGAPLEPPPEPGPGEPPPGEVTSPGPQPRSAGITAHDSISIVFDAALDTSSVPAFVDFLVMCGSEPADVDTVAVTGSQVDLTFMEDLPEGIAGMAVAYAPGEVPLKGKDGTPVAPFESFPVDTTAAP